MSAAMRPEPAPLRPAGAPLDARLEAVRRRVAAGWYDRPEVAAAVARRLLAAGDV